MLYVILNMLKEGRPTLYYVLAGVAFVLSQLAWFLLGKVICDGSGSKVDGSFIATILETATVGLLFLGWKSITEGELMSPIRRQGPSHNYDTDILSLGAWDDDSTYY